MDVQTSKVFAGTHLKNELTTMNRYVSLFSQLYHVLAYSIKKPKMQLEKSMFIISIDVDVGDRELGLTNRGKNDANVSSRTHIGEYQVGETEEIALPLLVETLNDVEIPVTFAVRGQLTEVNNSILELLLKSSVKHDIGAHGYYHKEFRNLSQNEAEDELKMISAGMKKFGITPRSFVFPRNSVAHLNLLEKYGYKCYRGYGDFMNDCMYIEKQDQLYNIHPSLFLDQYVSSLFLRNILDISVAKKLPFHAWSHLWNLGETKESIQQSISNRLIPLIKYAKKKEKKGLLSFETMLSAALKVESKLK